MYIYIYIVKFVPLTDDSYKNICIYIYLLIYIHRSNNINSINQTQKQSKTYVQELDPMTSVISWGNLYLEQTKISSKSIDFHLWF